MTTTTKRKPRTPAERWDICEHCSERFHETGSLADVEALWLVWSAEHRHGRGGSDG